MASTRGHVQSTDKRVDRTGWQFLLPLTDALPVGVFGALDDRNMEALADRSSVLRRISGSDELASLDDSALGAMIFPSPPSRSELGEARRVLSPGGHVWAFQSGRSVPADLKSEGFEDVRQFALLPDPTNLRIMVPVSEGGRVLRSALKMHAAGSWRGRLKIGVYGSGAFHLSALGKGPAIVSVARAPGAAILRGAWETAAPADFQTADLIPAVLSASAGEGRKSILGAYKRDGRPAFFMKIAGPGNRADFLLREQTVLELLASMPGQTGASIPRVLSSGWIGDSRSLVLEPLEGGKAPDPERMQLALANVAASIFNTTSEQGAMVESSFWRRIVKAGEADNLLTRALEAVRSQFEGRLVPFGLGHRDFVFWNIRVDKKKNRIFDWEWSETGHIPFGDLYHYHLHGVANASDESPVDVARRKFFAGGSPVGDLIPRYGAGVHALASDSWAYFVLYLADWIQLQSTVGNDGTGQVREYRRLLELVISDESWDSSHWLAGAF